MRKGVKTFYRFHTVIIQSRLLTLKYANKNVNPGLYSMKCQIMLSTVELMRTLNERSRVVENPRLIVNLVQLPASSL